MRYRNLPESLQNLVEFLLILSLSSEDQDRVHGIGSPPLEMPEYIEFEECYLEDIRLIKNKALLKTSLVREVESFMNELKEEDESFWYSYKQSFIWDGVRFRAKNIIKAIGLDELMLLTEFRQENEDRLEFVNLYLVIEKDHSIIELEGDIEKYIRENPVIIRPRHNLFIRFWNFLFRTYY